MLQLPEPPQPVDHRVMSVEERIIGGYRDLAHCAACPDVYSIVNLFDILAEVGKVTGREGLLHVIRCRQSGWRCGKNTRLAVSHGREWARVNSCLLEKALPGAVIAFPLGIRNVDDRPLV